MNALRMISTMSIAGLSMALCACASTPAQDNRAANDSQECKIVAYQSLHQSMAADTREMRRLAPDPNTPAEQALGKSEVGKLQLENPRRYARPATEPILLNEARHDC
jgi:hypothetical protein